MGYSSIGFIGGGNMAEAIIKGCISQKVFEPKQIIVYDINRDRLAFLEQEYGISTKSDNVEVIGAAEVIVLAVKPQFTQQVLQQIEPGIWRDKLLISVVAGIYVAKLAQWVSETLPIVRVMPNTPCLVGAGMTAISYNELVTQEQAKLAEQLFASMGEICVLPEALLDGVTGLSGSGPAYGYMIIEALSDGGVKMGLPRDVSLQLAVQTLIGAATMVKVTGKHPGELKDMVTSPGGTTIAALAKLEEAGLRSALISAVEESAVKAAKLGSKF